MKSKLVVKIILDITMFILFAVLTFGYGLSAVFHEIAGIAVFAMFVLHIILNTGLIKNLSRTKSIKGKLLALLDILLTAGVVVIMATSVFISKFLFPFILISDTALIATVHNITSYVCFGIMGVHLLFHAKYFVLAIKAICKNIAKGAVVRVLASFAVVCVVFALIYTQLYPVLDPAVQPESATVSLSQPQTALPAAEEEPKTTAPTTGTAIINKEDENTEEEDDTKQSAAAGSGTNQSAAVTLKEFLSKMFCTGCGKHCSLASPQCSRGRNQAAQAQTQYEAEYGDQ